MGHQCVLGEAAIFKNVASQKIRVFAYDYTTGQPKTGDAANITAYVSKDRGAVTVLGDTSATEADATNAPGSYLFDLTQAETNADVLDFSGKSSTSNIRIVPIDNVQMFPASFGAFVTPPTANENADALLDRADGVETGVTIRQAQRVQLAGIAGKADGLAGTTVHYRNQADTKNRITATVDANGNRSAVTLDAT